MPPFYPIMITRKPDFAHKARVVVEGWTQRNPNNLAI
jgi:hypothetical protein